MEARPKPISFDVLNVGVLLVILSIVGSTPRFMVISATLLSWLQTQWLGYVSLLKQRRSARLAAEQIRHKKEIAGIAESVGENVIALLDKRQDRVLTLSQDAERRRRNHEQVIVKRVIDRVVELQEEKDAAFKAQEERLLIREKKVKDEEASLQVLQKKLGEREQKAKVAEDGARKMYLKQDQELKDRERQLLIREWKIKEKEAAQDQKPKKMDPMLGGFGQKAASSPTAPRLTLPSNLLQYSENLKSDLFTCIGVTQKGARCRQSFIASADKSAAAVRIERMKSANPSGDVFELDALRELADWMLCPRWHRDKKPQGDTIARRWYYELSEARAALKNSEAQGSRTNVWTTPSFTTSFSSPSTGVPSIFSSGASVSSVESIQSVPRPYTGFGDAFSFGSTSMDSQRTAVAASDRSFKDPAARNLTPMFEFMSKHTQ